MSVVICEYHRSPVIFSERPSWKLSALSAPAAALVVSSASRPSVPTIRCTSPATPDRFSSTSGSTSMSTPPPPPPPPPPSAPAAWVAP
jgi:hypothetical protein